MYKMQKRFYYGCTCVIRFGESMTYWRKSQSKEIWTYYKHHNNIAKSSLHRNPTKETLKVIKHVIPLIKSLCIKSLHELSCGHRHQMGTLCANMMQQRYRSDAINYSTKFFERKWAFLFFSGFATSTKLDTDSGESTKNVLVLAGKTNNVIKGSKNEEGVPGYDTYFKVSSTLIIYTSFNPVSNFCNVRWISQTDFLFNL
jgi:hypothetical protein